MGGLTGGGGKSTDGGGFGLSGADLGLIQQALGMGTEMTSNRYQQLGLGVPDPGTFGGDPATAAAAGGSLQFGSPGTAQQMDVQGLGNMANATLGQLQTTNASNPAVAGSPASQIQSNNQLSQLAGQAAAGQGAAAAGSGVNVGSTGT